MIFVLVNGRAPDPPPFCALCCEAIGESYLRELATGLCYCDQRCFAEHNKVAARVPRKQAGMTQQIGAGL